MAWTKQRRDGEESAAASFQPRRRDDVRITESKETNGKPRQYFVKNLTTGEVFEFSPEDYFIFKSLDGVKAYEQIAAEFQGEFGYGFSRAEFNAFVGDLIVMQLASASADGEARAQPHPASPGGAGHNHGESASGAATSAWAAAAGANPGARSAGGTGFADAADPRQAAAAMAPPPKGKTRKTLLQWHLFNPHGLLKLLSVVLSPVRYFVWLVIPAVFVAGLTFFHRSPDLIHDLGAMGFNINTLGRIVLSLFALGLVSNLAKGVVIEYFGGTVKSLRFSITFLALLFAWFPRFSVDTSAMKDLPRRGQLWALATTLLTRLVMFSAATIVWATQRGNGTLLSELALTISLVGLWEFFVIALPLWPGDGYRWMATYFNRPYLNLHAYKLLGMFLKGRKAPRALTGRDRWILTLYAVLSVLVIVAICGTAMILTLVQFEQQYAGTGVVMFAALFVLAFVWLVVLRQFAGAEATGPARAAGHGEPRGAMDPPDGATAGLSMFADDHGLVVPFQRNAPVNVPQPEQTPRPYYGIPEPKPKSSRRGRLILAIILAALAVVAFLPYTYDSGGDFDILPHERYSVNARVDGEVEDVYVEQGDEVKKGQLLAQLSDWDQQRNLATDVAALDKAKADLQKLLDSPTPEDVAVAKSQVAAAESRIPFSKSQAERAAQLVRTGTMSIKDAEQWQSDYAENLSNLDVAKANLTKVLAGPMKSEIDAARAEVARLTAQVAFDRDQVARTKLVAGSDGRIVTANLQLLRGKYLNEGDLFTEIENHNIARAEIFVPEEDIGEVRINAPVRLKFWAYSHSERPGYVVAIAPDAQKQDYGEVVRVLTDVPNADGMIRPKMTGYAKIEGPEMPVWEAYTRMFVRFFLIEVWSWIP